MQTHSPLNKYFLCVFLTAVFLPASAKLSTPVTASARSILANGSKPQLVSRRFSFTEGPAADKEGNVFFTDQPNNKIWEYSTNGKLSVFLSSARRANGLYFDKDGNLIACADKKDQLISIKPNKRVKVLLNGFQGHRFNGPNDLWIAPTGGIYFTDPYYQRPYWTRTQPDIKGRNVYYLPKGEHQAIPVIKDMTKPNGIIGTPDGKHLYVADIGADKTYRYRIDADGGLSHKRLFVARGSDGMTLDNQGNVYLCGDGVTVFDKQGKRIAHIPIPEKWTANVTFGGKNKKLLFITASKGIYSLPMLVSGGR